MCRHRQTQSRRKAAHLLIVTFAIPIRNTDKAKRLRAGFRDVFENGARHQVIVGDDLEGPGPFVVQRLNDGGGGRKR